MKIGFCEELVDCLGVDSEEHLVLQVLLEAIWQKKETGKKFRLQEKGK